MEGRWQGDGGMQVIFYYYLLGGELFSREGEEKEGELDVMDGARESGGQGKAVEDDAQSKTLARESVRRRVRVLLWRSFPPVTEYNCVVVKHPHLGCLKV